MGAGASLDSQRGDALLGIFDPKVVTGGDLQLVTGTPMASHPTQMGWTGFRTRSERTGILLSVEYQPMLQPVARDLLEGLTSLRPRWTYLGPRHSDESIWDNDVGSLRIFSIWRRPNGAITPRLRSLQLAGLKFSHLDTKRVATEKFFVGNASSIRETPHVLLEPLFW